MGIIWQILIGLAVAFIAFFIYSGVASPVAKIQKLARRNFDKFDEFFTQYGDDWMFSPIKMQSNSMRIMVEQKGRLFPLYLTYIGNDDENVATKKMIEDLRRYVYGKK